MLAALSLLFIAATTATVAGQPAKSAKSAVAADNQAARSSPAFSELVLRRAEIEADLESLLLDFTEDYPKVKSNRFGLAQLQKQIDVLLAIKPADASKLTLALGKLMVKKVELDTDVWALQQTLADGHPDVKRAKRKVEIFDKAIRDILG